MKKNILVGVCGGIASYKTCELVRLLVKKGFLVKVMMTEAGTKFVTPLVFQNLSNDIVYIDLFQVLKAKNPQHISLAQWADLVVLAPLSANTLSKLAGGICDNLLSVVVCALPGKTKVLLAPAMNENMWKNPIIQENVSKLKKIKKYLIMSPVKGELACGVDGEGRMPEAEEIYRKIMSNFQLP
ncbi:MAG: flavoprotein [Candidatus Omnitrophota bacterium]